MLGAAVHKQDLLVRGTNLLGKFSERFIIWTEDLFAGTPKGLLLNCLSCRSDDWDYLPLIDFGIRLLKTIPSKRLNLAHLPRKELQNLRITYEEWNLSISPLHIICGFAALHILADGKCKKKLSNLISKALFGVIKPIERTIHEILNELCINHLKSKGAIRIYFEENHLLKFDDELVELIEKYYGTKYQRKSVNSEEKPTNRVVQTMCFQISPNGQALVNEMNKNIKEATRGNVEYVVRRDLPPKQQTRLTLITSFDSTFYWKPSGRIMEVKIFFYDTYEKIAHMRSVIKGYQCDGFFRTCLTRNDIRIVELDSEIECFKMYLFQPKKLFSQDFLKLLNAKKLQYYINQMKLERKSIIIPCFSINSPVGLRSVFASCNPFCHFIFKRRHPQFPYPCIARIFSPDKAEFGMIYGKATQKYFGPFHIYPVWDYYHKTKMALKTGQPKLKDDENEMPAVSHDRRTRNDKSIEKKCQQTVAVTGRIMIIGDQFGTDRKHFMIGILGNEKDKKFIIDNRVLDLLSKSKRLTTDKRKSLKNYPRQPVSSEFGTSSTVKKISRNDVDRRIFQRKKSLPHLIKKSIKHEDSRRKKKLSQQKRSKKKLSLIEEAPSEELSWHTTDKNSPKSSTGKSYGTDQKISKKDRTTKNDDSKNDYKNSDNDNKTQQSISSKYSQRSSAGGEIKRQNLEATTGQISSKKPTGNLNETTLQKMQSIFHLLKEPEIPLADKKDTIMAEQDERPSTNAYFMASESEVKDTQADIIFDTPFLYMIVSKSEMGRLLVASMGRFTNIQEINPPENMYDINMPILSTDDNINRNIHQNT
uniref:Serpin domain-containing protein n=1 Tax=Onchocerca volvulus TaxID=6282 RepID=A0A8R1XN45_ONCVO